MSEKFCLKWNDFKSNVSNSFSLLRNEDYLHDVTIVTDGNEQITAHKLVLSASSEYFKNIFKKNQHSHPMLCLEGVSSKDIRDVMDYIYTGEVQIFQEDLDSFLKVSRRLKIEGLQTGPEDDTDEEVKFKKIKSNQSENADIRDDPPFEKNKNNPTFNQAERILANVVTNINSENILEVDEQIEQNIVRKSDGTYSCNICGKNAGKKLSNMKNHIETHLEGLSFSCALCEKTYKSRNSFAHHRLKMHKNI